MSLPHYEAYKPIQVAWLDHLPAHWTITRLKFVLSDMGSGGTPDTENSEFWSENESGIPWVAISDMSDQSLIVNTAKRLTSAGLASKRLTVWPEGTLLFSMYASLGHTALLSMPATTNQAILALLPTKKMDKRFLVKWLEFLKPTLAEQASSNTQDNLNAEKVRNLVVVYPPQGEQSAIAAFLDHETAKIDALIAEQEKLIALLAEKRQATISHAVTRGLNPDVPMKDSGVAWLGEVPAHWDIKRLKSLSPAISVGIVVNPSEYISNEGLPFIYGGDISEGNINTENCRRILPEISQSQIKSQLREGDLLTVRVGAPGVTAVVPKECTGGNCASVMLIRKGDFQSDWLCFAMNSNMVRFQVKVVQYGAAQEQFNINHAVNFLIATPPLAEQLIIANYIKDKTSILDNLLAETNNIINLMQERRSALIAAAVTGQIDVRNFVAEAS